MRARSFCVNNLDDREASATIHIADAANRRNRRDLPRLMDPAEITTLPQTTSSI
jgi:hypothetical protein